MSSANSARVAVNRGRAALVCDGVGERVCSSAADADAVAEGTTSLGPRRVAVWSSSAAGDLVRAAIVVVARTAAVAVKSSAAEVEVSRATVSAGNSGDGLAVTV